MVSILLYYACKLDVLVAYKRTQRDAYKQIAKFDKIDMCKLMADVESYSVIRYHFEAFNESFKGNLHKCPYRSMDVEKISLATSTALSNGLYKTEMTFWNRNRYVGFFNWQTVVNMINRN